MADQTFAVHCGFFDAIDSDRVYSADEMNRPYRRIISNGVFATPQGNPSTDLQVVESTGMNIICKAGEGLFGDKWFENPSSIVITVPNNTSTVPRIDSVLVQVDTRTSGRVGNIVYRTGTPASSPTPPAINQTEGVVEYRLANIRVNAGVTSIMGRYITDRRGSSDCPWITSLIYQVDTSTLYDQWQAAYAEYFETEKAIWDSWYAQLTEDLDVSMTLDRHVNTVTTTAQTTGTIPIGLAYNHNTDILEVYINGLRAIEGTHYVVVDGDTSIMVENQLDIGQTVTFVVMRSVISGSATNITVLLQELESQIAGIAGGTPTVVDAKADMTEHDKIYILSTDGKWYYYSATAEDWVIGGTYGGVPTDPTLTQEGMAADAKTVGDALNAIDTRASDTEGDLLTLSASIIMGHGAYVNYDSTAHTLTFPRDTVVVAKFRNGTYVNHVYTDALVVTGVSSADVGSGAIVGYVNLTDWTIVLKQYGQTRPLGCAFLFSARIGYEPYTFVCEFPWSIDGKPYGIESDSVIGLLDITPASGYINSAGNISAADATKQEVHTDKIRVSEGDNISIEVDLTEVKSMWVAYATYDADGTFIEKFTPCNNVSGDSYSGTYTMGENVCFVMLSWRTYGIAEATLHLYPNVQNLAYTYYVDNMAKDLYPYGLKSPLFAPNKVGFIMHRGLSAQAPENTVPAFALAGQAGAWAIETDIQESTDGVFYCLHNATVDAMTDGTGTLSQMTSTQIDALTIDAGANIGQYPNLKIPTIDQFLAVCKKYGCVPVLDLKKLQSSNSVVPFVNKIKDWGLYDTSIVLCTSTGTINLFRNKGYNNMIAYTTYPDADLSEILAYASATKNCAVDLGVPDANLTKSVVASFHQANIPVFTWTTDVIADAEAQVEIGVDAISSNVLTEFV